MNKVVKELYKKGELPSTTPVELCPVCGSKPELWHFSVDFENGPITKSVMCSNGEEFGPQCGGASQGCLLYMPPQDFYRPTIREAVAYWNEYAIALESQRTIRAAVAQGEKLKALLSSKATP